MLRENKTKLEDESEIRKEAKKLAEESYYSSEDMVAFAKYAKNWYHPKKVEDAFAKWSEGRL